MEKFFYTGCFCTNYIFQKHSDIVILNYEKYNKFIVENLFDNNID